ncbi:glycosyltransferase [Desulfurispora thermophila]|uniref:glycosyltransferase n=1 Tax=Desulfurispora thermophila TaxID=265470 RepID=UPI00037C3AFD|nr:glycosyltransferase [Desulfurispora thermophila]
MDKITNRTVVCISSIDWDPLWTRKQQVMSRLPASCPILYVEPPITLLSPLKDRALRRRWLNWRGQLRRLPDRENIYLLTPPPVLPFGNKFRPVNRINQRWLLLFIRRAMRRLGLQNPLLWVYLPGSVDLVDALPHELLIYDCVDEHSAYTGLINRRVVLDMERELMGKCNLVFVTAPGLYEAKKGWARRIYYLPNAADVAHFGRAAAPETPLAPEMQGLPRPVLGFVGAIQDWIDLDLLARTARAYPQGSMVLIGPVGAGVDVSELAALPNVHLLGRRDKEVLPSYMKGFDVCLNPFKINELTDRVSPLKFYEYLATGKPVVSVDMPGVRDFAGVIEIAATPGEFVAAVGRALEQDTPQRRQQRLELARQHSWDSRVRFMVEKIEELL